MNIYEEEERNSKGKRKSQHLLTHRKSSLSRINDKTLHRQ